MDYRTYRFSRREYLRYGLETVGITGVVSFCFYNSLIALALWPVVAFWYLREKKGVLLAKRKAALKGQFKDAVQAIAAALAAGYSVENAVREAGKDLRLLYEERTDMVQELSAMERRMDSNQTLEAAVQDFAERSGLPEAETFAEIFAVGKRSGGDLIGILEDTARTIAQTVETERAIDAALASRRYEQKIMNLIPFVIVMYLRMGCPGFMEPVYGNVVGVCVMTRCSVKLLEKMNRRLLGKGYPGREAVAENFRILNTEKQVDEKLEEFYIEKLKLLALVLLSGVLLTVVLAVSESRSSLLEDGYFLPRRE